MKKILANVCLHVLWEWLQWFTQHLSETNNQTKSIVIIKAISSVVPSWVLLLRFSHFSFSLHPPTIQLEIDFPFRGKLLENLLFISRLASSTCATAINTMAEPFTRKFNRIRSDLSTRPKEKLNFRMSTFFLAGKSLFFAAVRVARCSSQRLPIRLWRV